MSGIKLKGVDLVTSIDEQVKAKIPTKISQLTNDSGYVTTSGSVASANTATTATNLTGTSGVTAGTYGPSANVTIANNNRTGSIVIPYFTVNTQGRITNMVNRTLKVTTGCNNCSVTSGCSQCNNCSQTSGCSNCNNCSNCNCQP